MNLRILSLNAGLLAIFGRAVPSPFVRERGARLPQEIGNLAADIVLLQEVYGNTERRAVAEALASPYSHAIYPRARRGWGIENGLMTLSRFPSSGITMLFRSAPWDEALFDSKGFLHSTHLLEDGLNLHIMNVHTTAGGLFHHPEHPSIDRIRALQIRQVLDEQTKVPSPVIIAGDMNAGPGVSESNFRQILDAGFVSVHDLVNGQSAQPTWDPLNALNSHGPHRNCPPQRIDHFFVRECDIRSSLIEPVSSRVCLQDPVVPVDGHQNVTISDHYGIIIEFSIRAIVDSFAASSAR